LEVALIQQFGASVLDGWTEYEPDNQKTLLDELCCIKWPTIARNTSGLSLATFWNSASSEDSDAPGCFSIKSSISFSAASMVLVEQQWQQVAESYQFIESLERLLLDQRALPPEIDMLPKDFPPE
jgi:hypothetical protein